VAECGVGARPRDFEFSPCGRWLLVGAQNGHSVAVLALDAARFTLRETGHAMPIGSPSCLRFLPR
jgi:6-phosphogluconolactonase